MELKEMQQTIKIFGEKNKMESKVEYQILDTISELGELSKEILKVSNYGRKETNIENVDKEIIQNIELEIGDVFYAFTNIANNLNIDIETAVLKVLEKYNKRLKKGSAGSESKI